MGWEARRPAATDSRHQSLDRLDEKFMQACYYNIGMGKSKYLKIVLTYRCVVAVHIIVEGADFNYEII